MYMYFISIHFLHFQTFQWKVLPVNKMVLFEDNNIQDYHVCALKIKTICVKDKKGILDLPFSIPGMTKIH